MTEKLEQAFRQCEMTSASETGLILVSKKGKPSIKIKKRAGALPVRIPSGPNPAGPQPEETIYSGGGKGGSLPG